MRRSRSLSNIPIPAHLRRDSKSRERSKSTLRQSRDKSAEGNTPLYKRGTSEHKRLFDRKGVTTPATPSFSTGVRRYGSSSCFGKRPSFTRSKSPTSVPIQKLVNDKKWVSEQYSKVQMFIRTSGLFNPELATMIRPPTINTFIELMSILFGQLITIGPINSQNYTEVVLTKLKMLRYPGSITMSSIKSANTMHGWPQFICMVSWLIDRVNLSSSVVVNCDEEMQKISDYQNVLWDFFINRYNIFSDGEHEDLVSQANCNLLNSIAKLSEIDLEAVDKYKSHYEALNMEVNNLQTQIEEYSVENNKIEQSNAEKTQVIQKFQDNKGKREQEVDEELQHIKKSINKRFEKRDNLNESIKKLKQDIATQSCKIQEKANMLKEIEELTRILTRKENKLAEYRSIKDDLDRDLRAIVVEIESRVDAWNVALTKTFLSEMKNLHLREKGFHSGDFLQEVDDRLKEKEHVEKQLLAELKDIKVEIEKIQHDKIILNSDIKEFRDKKKELEELEKNIQAEKEIIQNSLLKTEAMRKNYENQISKLKNFLSLRMQDDDAKIKDLDNQIEESLQQFNCLAKKGLALLIEAHNMTKQYLFYINKKMEENVLTLLVANDQDKNISSAISKDLIKAKIYSDKLFESLNQ
ncbi:hypothetical protein GWI33_006120 [Rhynchophorus ferrugineus]|uniref:Kinetochore protein NDC80 n=1 Tax=Rhynchophorus ferrugineus TaxID=354439 RepID=A0A834IGN6_RHYFE|nr:hypothetical protein GWI33_006120 [Rhynchophorus ferrugineus]